MNTTIRQVKKDAMGCLHEEVTHTSVVVMPMEHYVKPVPGQRPDLVSRTTRDVSEPSAWNSLIEVTEVTVRTT